MIKLLQIEHRISRITSVVQQVDAIQDKLHAIVEEAKLNDEHDYLSEFETMYFVVLSRAKALLQYNGINFILLIKSIYADNCNIFKLKSIIRESASCLREMSDMAFASEECSGKGTIIATPS